MSEHFDRYADEFGRRLSTAAASARPPRRRRLMTAAAGTAAAVVVVMVLALTSSSERLDPVAQAQAALAAPGHIVYMKITSTTMDAKAKSVPPPQTTERWSALKPLRWRWVRTIPRPSARFGGMFSALQRPLFGRQETAYDAGTVRTYNAQRDEMRVTRGYRDSDPVAAVPSGIGLGSGDPEADLRSMLFEGDVSDRGEQQLGGRTVRRFVSTLRRDGPNDPAMVLKLVYDVDPQTYAPIEARMSLRFPAAKNRSAPVVRLHVDTYRRIPLNSRTAKLLTIRTTPRTKVTTDTAQAVRERFRRWREERCRPRKSGDMTCSGLPPAGP